MNNYIEILEPEKIYHIYNHSIGKEKLFLNNENYHYFLKRYRDFIQPIAYTYSYCLLPNHFHFIIEIKNEQELKTFFKDKINTLTGFQILSGLKQQSIISDFLSRQFSHLFNSYAQSFNKQQNRIGTLFMRPFKRKAITSDTYLFKLVHYIHYNPVEAGICNKPQEWNYSSYNAIISDKKTLILKDTVIQWFNDIDNFIYCHTKTPELSGIEI